MDIDLSIQCSRKQILLTLAHLTGLEWLDDAIRNAEAPVRHCAVEIDPDGPSESAATRTGAKRIIEGKQTGCRRSDVNIAIGTMPSSGEAVLLDRIEDDDTQLPFSIF
jgi:hypothetical protein